VALERLVTMPDDNNYRGSAIQANPNRANFGLRATLGRLNTANVSANLGIPVSRLEDEISDLRSSLMFSFFKTPERNEEIRNRARELIANNKKPESPKLTGVTVSRGRIDTAKRKLPQNKKSGGKVYSRGSRKAKYNG
jgi:hypothetical protein